MRETVMAMVVCGCAVVALAAEPATEAGPRDARLPLPFGIGFNISATYRF
jgi:hypothetical protein